MHHDGDIILDRDNASPFQHGAVQKSEIGARLGGERRGCKRQTQSELEDFHGLIFRCGFELRAQDVEPFQGRFERAQQYGSIKCSHFPAAIVDPQRRRLEWIEIEF